MMTHSIESKIVGYTVKDHTQIEVTNIKVFEQQTMHEGITRPEILYGATYKIKIPTSEHALYVTINDYILNEGLDCATRHPYEIFINCKNMDHFQWVLALTRVISAVFRKGGDYLFLIGELGSVFDPKGGYFKGSKYVPSLVAEIGSVINKHMININKIKISDASEIDSSQHKEKTLDNAVLCNKCLHKSVVRLDGCMTCVNCGDSKCG